MNIPESLMKKIRGRIDLDADDTSRDAEIKRWTPRQRLRKVVGWELGDENWADKILEWANACGYKIRKEDL